MWSEGSACWRERGAPILCLIYSSSSSRPLRAHHTHFTLRESVFFLFLCSCLYLHPDVPVPLLQVHQHRPESSQNARDDAALCPAHVTMPIMPGHAQQQDPPAVPPHTPPQCGSWLCWQAYCHSKSCVVWLVFHFLYFWASNALESCSFPTCTFQSNLKLTWVLLDRYVALAWHGKYTFFIPVIQRCS